MTDKTLREVIARVLCEREGEISDGHWKRWAGSADAILAIPELREALRDAERLNFVASQSNGDGWICRRSSTGRGYRVHNDRRSTISLREAIDYASAIAAHKEEG